MASPLFQIAIAIALFSFARDARADFHPICPKGDSWDAAMAMCMPDTLSSAGPAEHLHHPDQPNVLMYDRMTSPDGCGPSEYFQFGMAMCLPRPLARGRFSGMLMGNVFLVDTGETGPRGRHSIAAPNWVMVNAGVDLAHWNRVELDVMGTAELWTYPTRGYAELLQIGEEDANGKPFLDAQHPHSSPLMGLQVTDVVSLSQDRNRILRFWFAPRGETTDGPIPFMHRMTATFNPDAPLGHHVGQDVGHVSSTVFGASLRVGGTLIEASTFNGLEPQPTAVDLPLAAPDSVGVRVAQDFSDRHITASASFAYINDPEGDASIPSALRLSASAYFNYDLPHRWRAHATAIWGGITGFDHASFLQSVTLEALFLNDANALWSRLEVLQRTPGELEIPSTDPNDGHFVGALTLGYTRKIVSLWSFDFSVGASGTLDFLPSEFASAYGGSVAAIGRLFLEARLMKMWAVGGRQ